MYESFYKLSAKPFALNPDPHFFYSSRSHKRAMSYLRYGLTQGEGFIVITGDVGSGKTLLVRTLFSGLAKENVVAAQLVTTQLDADEMLQMVAASFGLAHEGLGKATLLKNIETFLVTRAREGKRVLLVIDEAQNLPIRSLEELRMLSNFELAGRILLQSFLLGQVEFRNTFQSPGMEQLRQRVIAAYHLNPLDPDETKGYIEHRLRLVGWEGDPQFTDAACNAIHRLSEGIPRRINQICDRLLLFGYLEELHEFGESEVETVGKEISEETSAINPIKGQLAQNEAIHSENGIEGERIDAPGNVITLGAGRKTEDSRTVLTEETTAPVAKPDKTATASNAPLPESTADDDTTATSDDDFSVARNEAITRRLLQLEEKLGSLGEIVYRQQERLRDMGELTRRIEELQEKTSMLEAALRRQQTRIRKALLVEEEDE